jgi:hypothetical protein
MFIWLFILAGFPIMAVVWSFFWVHTLLRQAKQHSLDDANDLVQAALNNSKRQKTPSAFEAVGKALDVQESVQHLPEWPYAPSSIVAVSATLAAAAAQTAIALSAWHPWTK